MSDAMKTELAGRFKFVAHRPDGSTRVVADWFDNLILDAGLNRLGTGPALDVCKVGSGSTEPAVGQSSLVAQVAQSTNLFAATSGHDGAGTYGYARNTYRFAPGTATGNLSEVGVGWSDGLFSRALIKDNLGAPTTITILADETLDVVYELRMYAPVSDSVFNVTIAGNSHAFTCRPANISGSGGGTWVGGLVNLLNGAVTAGQSTTGVAAYSTDAALAARTGALSGTALTATNTPSTTYQFTSAYANNSYQRNARVTFGLDSGSSAFGGFMMSLYTGAWQVTVSPALAKSASNVLTLDFSLTWARKSI